MSDLFETFVFDLQRFAEWIKYGEIGKPSDTTGTYSAYWEGDQLIFLYDDAEGSSTEFANEAELYVETTTDNGTGNKLVQSFSAIRPASTDGSEASLYFSAEAASEETENILLTFTSGGGLYFDNPENATIPIAVHFVDAGDQLKLDAEALTAFKTADNFYLGGDGESEGTPFATDEESDTPTLNGFDLDGLATNLGDDGYRTLTLDDNGTFTLGELTVGDSFMFSGDIPIFFDGETEDTSSVSFTITEALPKITAAEGIEVYVATTEDVTGTGIQGLNVTVNDNDITMGTTGFAFFNGSENQVIYIYDTSFNADEEGGDEGEVSAPDEFGVITFTINDVAYKVKGMTVNENAFVLTDGEVTGFAFAEDETNAMIIFENGLPEGFTLYDGDPQTDIATEIVLPTITNTTGLVAVGKTVNDEEEATYSVIMGNGTVADADTTMTIAGLADDAVVQIVFNYDADGNAVILGVIPANDPLTTAADAEVAPFPAGMTIDVVETAENPANLIFADSMDAFETTRPVSTQNGQYTFSVVADVEESTTKTITLGTSDDTVYALDDATKLLLQSGHGSVMDSTDDDEENEDPTYGFTNAGGSAYFKVNSSAEDGEYQLSGFIFADEGDAIGRDYTEDEGNGGLSLGYLDNNDAEQTLAVTPEVDANHFVTMTHKPTEDGDPANFAVYGFSKADTKVTVGDAEFIFGASAAGNELGFDEKGNAYGISATSTVTMNDAAAALLADDDDDADPFLINGEEVDITANLAGDSLVFNADDDGEQSLLGLGNGSEIANAGGITKVYGASGTNNELTVGETTYTYSAKGSSAADLASFTVNGDSATGFTFATDGDALKVTDEMTDADFALNDKDEGAIDTPSVYDSEGNTKDEYTLTKVAGTTYGMSGFEEGDFAEIGSGSVVFETLAEGSSAAITFDAPTGVVGGVSYLVEGDAVKVNGISTAINFDGDEVEIVTDSYTYNKTGEDTSAITDLYALEEGTTIKQLGGASYVQTAAGESGVGKYVFEQSGQSFAVEPTEDTDDEDFDGVKFVIGSDSSVSAIEDVSDKEFVYGSSTAFAGVSQVNGQSFDVTGAGHLSFIGNENSDAVSQLNAYDGNDVVVTDAAGASYVGVKEVDSITFADNTFAISGTSRAVLFTVDDDLTVTGLSYVGATETVTGGFSNVTTVNGQSFAVVDKDGVLTVIGNEGESGLSVVEGITGGASVFDVAGASKVVTDTEGEFYFDGNGSAFTVEGDSTVTFQMDTTEDALVEGVTNFGDGVAATLTGALSGIDINDNDDAIAVTNDADQIFDYMTDGKGNATLGGVGASKADDEVVITGTGGASVVNVTTDGIYTFKLGGALGGKSATFTLDIAEDDADGVNFVLDEDGNVVKITSFDKGDVVSGNFSESAIAFEGVNGASTATTNVQVDGDDISVVHDDYIIKDVSDLDTIKTADGIVEAYTESLAAGDTLQVTDTDGDVFVVAANDDDADGVTLILDGAANIVGVSSLAEGSTLGGSLSKLEAVNGVTFDVIDPDGDYSVVGGGQSIAAIVGVGEGTTVNAAGGASKVITESGDDGGYGEYYFTKGGQSFGVYYDDEATASDLDGVEFLLDTAEKVTAIADVNDKEFVDGYESDFADVEEINGQSFDVKGASYIAVMGNSAATAAQYIYLEGGSSVVVNETASAIAVNAVDVTNIQIGSQSFFMAGVSDATDIEFYLDGTKVTNVSAINDTEVVIGNFNNVVANGTTFDVQNDNILAVVGNKAEDGLNVVGLVSDGAVVNDVGGASQVITDEEGTFTFADSGDFDVVGDSSVTFQMNTNAAASVAGITNFATDGESTAMVAGKLNGLFINDKGTIDVKGDADDILAYIKETYEGETLYGLAVAGSSVTVNGAASATIIEAGSDGVYTFAMDKDAASTTYTVATAGDSAVLFEVEGNDVVGIYDMDKETSVTGDFSNGVFVEGISTSGVLEDGSVQILNDSVVTVVYDDFEVKQLSDGASITSFTDFKHAYTEGVADDKTLAVYDADGDQFVIAGDSDGVHYLLDGTGNIVGVSGLDAGAVLSGNLGALSSVNGVSFDVKETATGIGGDGQFSVVGAEGGIGAIVGLGGSVAISDAGSAVLAATNDDALITFKDGGQFYVGGISDAKPEVGFVMDGSNAVAIVGVSSNELVMGSGSAFEALEAVNTQDFDVKGASALVVVGNDDNDGLTAIAVFGGSNVAVNAAASATDVLAADVDQITFGESSTFQIEGESTTFVTFEIDSALNVGAVSYVGAQESVTGNFNDINTVNGTDFDVTDSNEIMVVGNEDVDGLTKVANVSDSAVIANVAGASQVITDTDGTFTFTNSNQVFEVHELDDSVTFDMNGNDVANVNLDFGVVISDNGNFANVSVNGAKVDIKGDEDDMAIGALSSDGIALVARVGGVSGVVVNSAGGASFVVTDKEGTFTFTNDGRAFDVGGDSQIIFVLDENENVVAVTGADKGASITSDFTKAVAFAGYSNASATEFTTATVQIANDPDVMVVHDDFEVHMLSNGASISSATTVEKAYTDSANLKPLTVTDASGDEFTVYGDADGVMYSLDGAGEIIAVDGLDEGATLGGSLSALKSVNGVKFHIVEAKESVSLHSGDEQFSVVGAKEGISEVIGLSGLVSVAATGGASVLRADGNIVLINDAAADPQLFAAAAGQPKSTVFSDSDGFNFFLNNDSIHAIDGIGSDEVVLSNDFDDIDKLNNKDFNVINDDAQMAVLGKDGNNGINAVIGVGNSLDGATVVAAAGASFVLANSTGAITFGSGSKADTFTLTTDADSIGVGFYIDDNLAVQSIDYVNKEETVFGNFTNGRIVNGDSIKASDNIDSLIGVAGNNSYSGVTELFVQANATVTAWGNASSVNALGAGDYVFIGADNATQTFTAADTSDSLLTFVTDKNRVTGVEELSDGYIRFDPNETGSASLDVNIAHIPGQTMTFASTDKVSLTVDPYEVVIVEGVTGSVSGVVGKETPATVIGVDGITSINVNGKDIYVDDDNDQFNVVVHDTAPDYLYNVDGDATVLADNVSVRANSAGTDTNPTKDTYVIGGESYVFDDSKDENDGFTFVTDENGTMNKVASLEGALVINDGEWDGNINGDDFEVIDYPNKVNPPVTVNSGASGIESVGGLDHKDTVNGDLGAAQVHIPGYGEEGGHYPGTTITINGKPYTVVRDFDGVDVTGDDADVITDLDNQSSLIGAEGPVTVNGTALEPEEGDVIKGDRDDNSHARIVGDDELIRQATAINHYNHQGYDVDTEETTAAAFNIEDVVGLPVYTAAPTYYFDREDTDAILAGSSTYDFNQPLIVSLYNIDPDTYEPYKTEQVFDMSSYSYTKKVYMNGEGPQAVKFNNAGGNLAVVADGATGVKNVSLGAGGDAVVMDEDYALQNAVYIYGGTGDDSVFVRHNANTYIDFSAGGSDILVTAGEANARVSIAGYQASTGAAIRVEEYLDVENEKAGTVAQGIENGIISFAEGTVIITSDEGRSELYIGTNGAGGQIVNLMTHATSSDDYKQAVGFTGVNGGLVDGSTYQSPLIMIGNNNNTDTAGSTLLGGSANDTFYGGEGDFISTGYGNDYVSLFNDSLRGGATVVIGDGRTTIEGMNNTLADSTGDIISVAIDPQDATFSLLYNDSLKALEIESSADGYYALLTDVDVYEGNYTTQYIYDEVGEELYSVAIGTVNSTIQVTEDEDLRPNVFFGYQTAIDFRGYTGDAIIDLRGDMAESIIDETIVIIDDDITTLYAGIGDTALKGDLDDETLYAGKGNTWLYGDGGKNLLVGYEGADKEGQTVFYVLGNEDGAAHTISGFNYVTDDNYTDTKKVTADALEFDLDDNNITRIDISGSDLVIEITDKAGTDTESALLKDAINADGTGKDFIVSDNVAQVAEDTLVFDQFADYYYATGKNATVQVSGRIEDDVVLWLDEDETGKVFEGDIAVIDATQSDATAQLAGNENDNVIYAGTGETSLWGGEGGNDLLVGNAGGRDTFYYSFGNGDDTITNVKDGDVIALDVSLDQIDEIDMSDASAIRIIMNDGDVLTINDAGHDVNVMIDNGEDGTDTYSTREARSRQ